MIARLKGVVVELQERAVIVDVGGIGFRVVVPPSLKKKMKPGREIELRTHHHVSAESEELYGFETAEYLEYFELLLTVPSIGVRTAMGVLEIAPPATLAQAVAGEDVTLLTKVSGVGKKTAERIIVELKSKLAPLRSELRGAAGQVRQEAIEALTSIGYTGAQARAAMAKLPSSLKTVEEIVRWVLKSGK